MKKYIVFLGGLLAASCVSQKKYDALAMRHSELQSDSTALVLALDEMRNRSEACEDSLNRASVDFQKDRDIWMTEKQVLETQIALQGDELSEKDQALRDRAERLQELQSRLDDQTEATRALRRAVSQALVQFSDEELQVSIEDGRVKVSLSENLLFPSGSVEPNPKGVEALGKLAVVLKNNPSVNINIVGSTDSLAIKTARFRNNWDLSVVRASSIATILQEKYGVDGGRLTASGRGEFDPIAENTTPEGRALNRRTDIYLVPQLDALMEVLGEEEEQESE